MLATSPASRRRLASGAAAVGALLVAGLGLTASASGAAAIGAGVQQAVASPPAPPAPPTPPHQVRKVAIVKNGKTTIYDHADVDAHLAAGEHVAIVPLRRNSQRVIVKADGDPDTRIEIQDIPAAGTASCGIGTGTPTSMLVGTGKGPKRLIVVCTDRIRRATADGMVSMTNPRDVERNAYAHALAGLLDARTRAVADAGLSDADRSRAVAAIDTSITEMKGQLARFN